MCIYCALLGGNNLLLYYGSTLQVTYTPTQILLSDTQLSFYLQGDVGGLSFSSINIPSGLYSYKYNMLIYKFMFTCLYIDIINNGIIKVQILTPLKCNVACFL